MNRVPFIGFADEPDALKEQMATAALSVIDSSTFVLGSKVRAFEERWAAECGTKESVGVANGLDAIEIALRALGIGPGSEVITTPMTAVATALAIIRAGATPVLADIDPDTALLDPTSAARCITPRTRAVLLVHLYGQVRDMSRWEDLCASHNLVLLEDCAQAHLAKEEGIAAGAFGVAGAYSFYPTKNLGALGDAGALVTNDPAVAEQSRQLRNYGQSNRYEHPLLGLNSRLDEMQAALLNVRLDHLAAFTQRRREVAAAYRAGINNQRVALLAPELSPEQHVYHLFVVRTDDRDALAAHLDVAGIDTLIHYPIPAHQQASLKTIERDPEGLPHAEQHAASCLSLPCHPQMTSDQVDRVINAVNSFGSA